jgi:serine/threonine protein kinase
MTDLRPLVSGDPARVGDFELLGRLGEGAQGVVYLGRDGRGGQVAVKLLKAHLDADLTARERFIQELRSTERVARFCTAQVLAADLEGDRPYIVSEYVEGRSLAEVVRTDGPLTGGALERLAIGTATALVAIHKAGVVHRDFKPHNVLLGPDGPRVIDFGIAKALDTTSTVSSAIVGTPAYMAPEQVAGAPLSNRVDVFAWAATMIFAATGAPPFGQDSIPAVIGRLLHGSPDFGTFDGPVRTLAEAALSRDPSARPTAQQLLLRLLGQDDTAAVSTTPPDLLQEAATMVAEAVTGPRTIPTVPVGNQGYAAQTDPGVAAFHQPPGSLTTSPGGGFGPPSGFGPPPPRKKRGAALPIAGTAVAVALILLLGGVVGYKILTSSSDKPSTQTAATKPDSSTSSQGNVGNGSPAADDTSPGTTGSTSPSGGQTYTTVPWVAGKDKDSAISLLRDKGLHYSVVEQYSDTVYQGNVISSDPGGGNRIGSGGRVTLYVSKGKKSTCTVPSVIGKPDGYAKSIIESAGLTAASSGGTGASDDVVISQHPAAGSSCQPGDTVTYTLGSSGGGGDGGGSPSPSNY